MEILNSLNLLEKSIASMLEKKKNLKTICDGIQYWLGRVSSLTAVAVGTSVKTFSREAIWQILPKSDIGGSGGGGWTLAEMVSTRPLPLPQYAFESHPLISLLLCHTLVFCESFTIVTMFAFSSDSCHTILKNSHKYNYSVVSNIWYSGLGKHIRPLLSSHHRLPLLLYCAALDNIVHNTAHHNTRSWGGWGPRASKPNRPAIFFGINPG